MRACTFIDYVYIFPLSFQLNTFYHTLEDLVNDLKRRRRRKKMTRLVFLFFVYGLNRLIMNTSIYVGKCQSIKRRRRRRRRHENNHNTHLIRIIEYIPCLMILSTQ